MDERGCALLAEQRGVGLGARGAWAVSSMPVDSVRFQPRERSRDDDSGDSFFPFVSPSQRMEPNLPKARDEQVFLLLSWVLVSFT